MTLSEKSQVMVIASAMALVLILGSMNATYAESNAKNSALSKSPSTGVGRGCIETTVTPITLPSDSTFGLTAYNCLSEAKQLFTGMLVPEYGWDPQVFSITNHFQQGIFIHVSLTDCCFIADHYRLWETSDPTLQTGWFVAMNTPAVETDSHLVAPSYNPLWDGNGITSSSHSGQIFVPAGQTVFLRVNNALYIEMGKVLDTPCSESTFSLVTNGCSVPGVFLSPQFSPAGYSINFNR